MQCANHADAAAAALCTRCDQPICEACTEERRGKQFCTVCAQFVDQRAQQRAASMAAPPRPDPGPAPSNLADTDDDAADLAGPTATATAPTPVSEPTAVESPEGDAYPDVWEPMPESGEGQIGLYSGDAVPNGPSDVYQGPAPGDDLFATPAPGGPGLTAVPAGLTGSPQASLSQTEGGGQLSRAALWGVGAGAAAAFLWYGISAATEWKLGAVAALVGAVVGWTTASGAARRGPDVGLLAAVIALASMTAGEYLMWSHFYKEFAQEEAAYSDLILEIGADGRYTRSELERYYLWGEENPNAALAEFDALSSDELSQMRGYLREEHDAWTAESGETTASAELPMGEFFNLLLFDLWNIVFFGIGIAAAYRIGAADE